MTAVDPVAAYEAGVQNCHGAPQRPCCVRAGLNAVQHHHDTAPTPTPTPDPVRGAATATAGARIITAALAWRHGSTHETADLIAAIDAHQANCPCGCPWTDHTLAGCVYCLSCTATPGWGAMLQHGTSADDGLDVRTYGHDTPVPSRCSCGAWGGHHTAHCPLGRPTISRPPSQETDR